jgi:hypothetical protein
MTDVAAPPSVQAERSTARKTLVPLGAAVLGISSMFTVLGAHDVTEIVVCTVVAVAATIGVYGFLLPRALERQSAGGTALALSVIAAVLTLPAFWTGLPLVLGAAGALLGYVGRNAASGGGKSIAAVVLGALAAIGYLAIYVSESISGRL